MRAQLAGIVDDSANMALNSRRVISGCVVAALATGIVGGTLVVYAQWQNRHQPARVEAAVRATFPQFCARRGERLSLERDTLQWPWQFDRWTVACQPSPFPWREAVMVVNLSTCTAEPSLMATDEGHLYYGDIYGHGQKLLSCP